MLIEQPLLTDQRLPFCSSPTWFCILTPNSREPSALGKNRRLTSSGQRTVPVYQAQCWSDTSHKVSAFHLSTNWILCLMRKSYGVLLQAVATDELLTRPIEPSNQTSAWKRNEGELGPPSLKMVQDYQLNLTTKTVNSLEAEAACGIRAPGHARTP